ncbi:MAG: hypothetical protein ACKVZH_08620 [Blastocatellia bacterium]
MSKVVVERPRHNHSLPSYKTALRVKRYDDAVDYDDMPKRVSGSRNKHVRSSGAETKSFSDLLGPLRRFLRSNVGRPWDKVYSELSQHLDKRKATGIHIFDHARWEVEQECFVDEDGKVRSSRGHRLVSGLYVHPVTKLLCWSNEKSRWQKSVAADRAERQQQSKCRVPIKGNQNYVKLNGIWYVATLEEYRRGRVSPELEALLTLVDEPKTRYYTATWQVLSKRQCGKKELKAAGLSNDRPK